MKIGELRDFTKDELENKETELKDQFFKLKFQQELGQLENTMKLKEIKRDIARIKTLLRESEEGKK